MRACQCRHPIFCILPPYILRSVVEKGSPEQKQAALGTLSVDSTFRAMRAYLGASTSPEVRRRRRIGLTPGKQRTIATAGNRETLPGKVVRGEGVGATGDIAVDEAYDGLGHTFDFFWENYQRNSIDDEGLPLSATVHYGKKYNNAFWNGQRMVFGDGDPKLFNRFTISLDVIGHELGHGVTEDEAGLAYIQQPGALNEHLSDVWGSLIKQWVLKQTADKADWLIGAGLLAPGVKGKALRSMKAPGTAFDDPVLGKDPQPDHMDKYVDTFQDHGGVHINSGIPNKAFYLAATSIGGRAWEKAGLIWYQAVRDPRVTEGTKFADFSAITVDVANRLPGFKKADAKAVADAWAQVGVSVSVTS
jgi:Zn-dependent metalloprotease